MRPTNENTGETNVDRNITNRWYKIVNDVMDERDEDLPSDEDKQSHNKHIDKITDNR